MQLFGKALHRSRVQRDFEIRRVASEDNEIVTRVIREVMTEFACVGEGYSINDLEVENIYEAYHNDRSAFFVLTRQSVVVGCGGIGSLAGGDSSVCELKKMYFLPEARGLGLGQKFIGACLEKAKILGYEKCYLETVRRMWQANMVYEKMGFKSLSKPMGNTGHNSTEVWMVRDL
jgi:putative acetyltransferase